jgi:hypothetical protein
VPTCRPGGGGASRAARGQRFGAARFLAALWVERFGAESFMKDFVVVKTFSRYHAENPSQQQKFTLTE